MSGQAARLGFTLAEVLITLGIIGVVAALTMPVLVANYSKKADVAKLKKAYTVINQAFKLSEVDNGASEHWENAYDIGAAVYFEKYWQHYFQGASLCETYKKCGYNSITPWKYLNGNASGTVADMSASSNSRVLFYSNDGILYVIFTTYGDMLVQSPHIFIDINGGKAPTVFGKDVFSFVRQEGKGIYPEGYNLPSKSIDSNCSKQNVGTYCAAKIMRDGWEVKY